MEGMHVVLLVVELLAFLPPLLVVCGVGPWWFCFVWFGVWVPVAFWFVGPVVGGSVWLLRLGV